LKKAVKFFKKKDIRAGCVQTESAFKFTNRFFRSEHDLPMTPERTAMEPGIRHKLIHRHTRGRNHKGSRREDQKRFYDSHAFYSLHDFAKRLTVQQGRTNDTPVRLLKQLTPFKKIVAFCNCYLQFDKTTTTLIKIKKYLKILANP